MTDDSISAKLEEKFQQMAAQTLHFIMGWIRPYLGLIQSFLTLALCLAWCSYPSLPE